jgi:HEAT repeat protein
MEREGRERAVDRLMDLTRDEDERVRMRAATGLGGLGEARALPAIEGLKRSLSNQDSPRLERIATGLRKGGPGEEQRKLREQVEKLEERCRKLDERLQDLEARDNA